MDEYERRRKDLLEELSRRFNDSAGTMRAIARRIGDVARADESSRRRAARTTRALREGLDASETTLSYTYLEYLEFMSAAEFRRFRDMPVVSEADLEGLDWDKLARQLQA